MSRMCVENCSLRRLERKRTFSESICTFRTLIMHDKKSPSLFKQDHRIDHPLQTQVKIKSEKRRS